MAQLIGRDRRDTPSATVVEERPDGVVVVEADTPEEALALARDRLGGQLQVREALRLERGGVKGFFAREVYRVVAEPGVGAATGVGAGTGVRPEVRPEVEALVRRIDAAAQSSATEAGRDEGVGRAVGQVDAEEEEFGELLRRELDARGVRSWSPPPPQAAGPSPTPAPAAEPATARPPVDPRPPTSPGAAPTPPPDTIDLRDHVASHDRPPAVPVPVGPAAGGRVAVPVGPAAGGRAAVPVPVGPAAAAVIAPVATAPAQAAVPAAAVVNAPAPAGSAPTAATPPAPTSATEAPSTPGRASIAASPARPTREPAPGPAGTTGVPDRALASPTGRPAVRWSIDRLAHLGLPFAVVQRTVGLDPDDDLAWVSTLAEAFVPFVSGELDGPAVYAGPRADRLAAGLGVPCVVPPELPPYAGSVGLRTQDDGAGRAWLGRVRGDRSLHVVVGGRGWELFLTKEPDALALAGTDRIVTALQAAVEHRLPVSYLAEGGVTRRATALDLAIAVRSMVARS